MTPVVCLPDGRRLAWREAGAGPSLVLVHGWAMSSAVFTEAMADLSRNFRVLAPDLRGHGDSDGGPGYALSDFAADLAAWAAALDLKGAAFAGWSLGGQVVLEAFPLLRSRVRRLILIGTTPRFAAGEDWSHGLPDGQVRAMARDLRRNYEKTMGDFFALQFAGEEIPRDRYRAIVRFAVREGRLPEPEVALRSLETLRGTDRREALAGVDCPTLVMHGEMDRIVPPGAGRFLAGHLPSADLSLLPGTGHAPFFSCPQEVFEKWRDFLA